MSSYAKSSIGKREKLTHRYLYYLHKRTSPKFPEWRDQTIRFFFELFELMNANPGLNLTVHRVDGMRIYSGGKPIAFLHFYQRHFLVHCERNYLLWDKGNSIFRTKHRGSWPRMWKATSPDEVTDFLAFLARLPIQTLSQKSEASRTIPPWVQEFVYERDRRCCVACGSKIALCFDHILPFSKGGSSEHPNNIQLLCSKCNSEKSANFRPIKVMG